MGETWTQFVDWNGDGRLDVIDARGGSDDNHWRVWINEDSHGLVVWRATQVSVKAFRAYQAVHGLDNTYGRFVAALYDFGRAGAAPVGTTFDTGDVTPLARTKSWVRNLSYTCKYVTCNPGEQPIAAYPDGTLGPGNCSGSEINECPFFVNYTATLGSDTWTEWEIKDLNTDGHPDLVTESAPAMVCDGYAAARERDAAHPFNFVPAPYTQYMTVASSHSERLGHAECPATGENLQPTSGPPPGGRSKPVAFLNRLGAFDDVDGGVSRWADEPFDAGLDSLDRWRGGVATDTATDDEANQPWRLSSYQTSKLVDWLGSGRLWVKTTREGFRASPMFENDREDQCATGGAGRYTDRQRLTDVDINGDGLPDMLSSMFLSGGGLWSTVELNTGVGTRSHGIMTAGNDAVTVSEASGDCDQRTESVATLTDMDGDGLPERVWIHGDTLLMASLLGGGGQSPLAAGRLVAVTNGHGARTTISYANAKNDATTAHAVPVPEIVVSAVNVSVDDLSAPDNRTTYYAYGDARYGYDGMAARWAFLGYGRHIEVSGRISTKTGIPLVSGVLAAYDFGAPALPNASFADLATASKLQRVTMAEGDFDPEHLDPYLLPGSITPFAGADYGYAAVQRPASWEETQNLNRLYDCGEFDHGAAIGAPEGCTRNGLVYQATAQRWEGIAMPSVDNVLTGSSVVSVDAWGRPTQVRDSGDLRRNDDDVCQVISYANGTPFPSVVTSVTTTDCGSKDGTVHTLAASRLLYDGLPFGQVSRGRVTSRYLDRYDATGYLGTFLAGTYGYDTTTGELQIITSSRTLGSAATRTTQFAYDAFGLTTVSTTSNSSDVSATFTSAAAVSTWPSIGAASTDPSGITRRVEFDAFARPTRRTVEAGGTRWTLEQIQYDDDPGHRRVTVDLFPGTTLTGNEANEPRRQRATTVLDALARPRFSQAELGTSYGNATIVSGLVQRDELGRVVFAADAFEAPAGPFNADVTPLPAPVRYGVTTVYDRRGRAVRMVEGPGDQTNAFQTSTANKVYVADTTIDFLSGQAIIRSAGPDEHDPTSPRYGHFDQSWTTALGREVKHLRKDAAGLALDKIERDWDALGRVVTTRRYATPTATTGATVWTTQFDSLGQVLRTTEPGVSDRVTSYDEDGNPLDTVWYDGTTRKAVRQRYDGLGRLASTEVVSTPAGASDVIESRDVYHYDVHSGQSAQPTQAPDLLRGRLSWIENTAVGKVYYGYDPLGRGTSEVYAYTGVAGVSSQSTALTAGGTVTSLTLTTPWTTDTASYDYDSAWRTKSIKSGGTTLLLANAISTLGQYQAVMYGNGASEFFTYAGDGRREPLSMTVMTATGAYMFEQRARDAMGRVTTEVHSTPTGAATFATDYDSLGRIASRGQTGGVQPGVEAFTYDGLGNLSGRVSTTGSGNRTYTTTTTDADRLCRFAAPGSGTACQFTYDGAGNVVTDTTAQQTRTFKYDAAQRITQIAKGSATATFLYGPLGRVKTSVAGTNARVTWRLGDLIERHEGPSGLIDIERRIPGPLGVFVSLRTQLTSSGTPAGTEAIYNHGDGRAQPRLHQGQRHGGAGHHLRRLRRAHQRHRRPGPHVHRRPVERRRQPAGGRRRDPRSARLRPGDGPLPPA